MIFLKRKVDKPKGEFTQTNCTCESGSNWLHWGPPHSKNEKKKKEGERLRESVRDDDTLTTSSNSSEGEIGGLSVPVKEPPPFKGSLL